MPKVYSCLLALGIFAAHGCAHSPNPQIDAKLGAQEEISSKGELQSEVVSLIMDDPNLSAEQKDRLMKLHSSHVAKVDEIEKQNFELKALLAKDLLATNYNAGEVKEIKSRLRKNEDKRMSALFEAVEEANKILGRDARHSKTLRAFMGTASRRFD